MEGRLFVYGSGLHNIKLCAFESGTPRKNCLILLGGLTDGLLGLDYCNPLSNSLQQVGFSLIQPIFSSSYLSYGISSLEQDAKELNYLLQYLLQRGTQQIFLMGHSTGCQDIVFWSKNTQSFELPAQLKGVILQAPASDRLYMEQTLGSDALRDWLNQARNLRSSDSFLPRTCNHGIPITPERFESLFAINGADDLFSADLDNSVWIENFRSLTVPTLVVFSGADEYVPFSEQFSMKHVRDKFTVACPHLVEFVELPDSNHAITNSPSNLSTFIQRVIQFVCS